MKLVHNKQYTLKFCFTTPFLFFHLVFSFTSILIIPFCFLDSGPFEMYTIQERVRIIILMAKYESVTAVKRQLTKAGFQHKPTDQTIRLLYKKFLETGSVEDKVRSGRLNLSVNPENAQKVVAILEDKENFYSVPAISNISKWHN